MFPRIAEKDQTVVKSSCGNHENLAWHIRQVTAGDEAAFAQLYDATSGFVFGLLLRIPVSYTHLTLPTKRIV